MSVVTDCQTFFHRREILERGGDAGESIFRCRQTLLRFFHLSPRDLRSGGCITKLANQERFCWLHHETKSKHACTIDEDLTEVIPKEFIVEVVGRKEYGRAWAWLNQKHYLGNISEGQRRWVTLLDWGNAAQKLEIG